MCKKFCLFLLVLLTMCAILVRMGAMDHGNPIDGYPSGDAGLADYDPLAPPADERLHAGKACEGALEDGATDCGRSREATECMDDCGDCAGSEGQCGCSGRAGGRG